MRKLLVLLLALGALTLAGCGSADLLPTRVRERLEPPQPKTHVFAAAKAPVFEAVQAALRRLDFQVSRAGAAQGLVRAHSGLRAGESFGKARQYAFEIHVDEIEPGRTEVSAVLREQEESDSFAGATDIPQREHGLYDSLFAATEQVLREHGALAAEPAK